MAKLNYPIDLINIAAVTIFGVEHRFDDGFTYGEAFWMTLCSTIASTITNISLIVDLIRTPDFAKRGMFAAIFSILCLLMCAIAGSGLTRKQRALMIIVIVLLVYIAFGALVNSILLHLTFIDGLYFTVVSIETIGFGDIVPRSTGARVWTCVYVVVGVVNIGVAIAMCRETIIEGLEIGYRRRMRDMRQRRREARRFRRWEARWQRAVEFRLREAGLPIWVPEAKFPRHDTTISVANGGGLPSGMANLPFFRRVGRHVTRTATMTSTDQVFGKRRGHHLNVDALSTAQLEEAALEAGVPLDMFLDLSERRNERASTPGSNPAPVVTTANGLPVPAGSGPAALAQTGAAHAFRDSLASGWPAHPHTPTHAQVGRMAAMLTKFAVAIAGAHAHAPGLSHGEYLRRHETQERENRRASEGEGERGAEAWRNPAGKWLKDFSRGASHRSGWTYEKYKADMEAEEKKAYYVKVSMKLQSWLLCIDGLLQVTIAWSLFFLFWTVRTAIQRLLDHGLLVLPLRSGLAYFLPPRAGPTGLRCISVRPTLNSFIRVV